MSVTNSRCQPKLTLGLDSVKPVSGRFTKSSNEDATRSIEPHVLRMVFVAHEQLTCRPMRMCLCLMWLDVLEVVESVHAKPFPLCMNLTGPELFVRLGMRQRTDTVRPMS